MKDFFEYRQELQEAKGGGIKSELNKLQQWWDENALDLGFMDPVNPKKIRLFPILETPFDMIRSGGILVMGYNPGAGGSQEAFENAVALARKKDGAGKLPLLYDKKKGGWYYIHSRRNDDGSASDEAILGRRRKRYNKRGEDIKLSVFNSEEWLSANGVNKNMHTHGSFPYHRAFNKMLDDLELGHMREKVMATNFIPFNSKNDSIPNKGKVEKACVPWVQAFIKSSKPSLIFTTTTIYKKMKTHLGVTDNSKSKIIRKASNNHTFYQAGNLPDGTPVIAFAHWSASHVGGPSNPNWNEENVDFMKLDIKRMMGEKTETDE